MSPAQHRNSPGATLLGYLLNQTVKLLNEQLLARTTSTLPGSVRRLGSGLRWVPILWSPRRLTGPPGDGVLLGRSGITGTVAGVDTVAGVAGTTTRNQTLRTFSKSLRRRDLIQSPTFGRLLMIYRVSYTLLTNITRRTVACDHTIQGSE